MIKRLTAALLGLAAFAAGPAFAQTAIPSNVPGINLPPFVELCQDAKGMAQPCALAPRSVTVLNPLSVQPYPAGAYPITGIGVGTTGATVGTLAAAPGRTTYICGFDVSALGGTAAVGPIVVAGLTGGSFTYQFSSTAAGVTLNRAYWPCIPASGIATAITVTTTADGSASAVDVNAWGFQL